MLSNILPRETFIRSKQPRQLKTLVLKEEKRLKSSPGYAARQAEEAILQQAREEAERIEHEELQKKWEKEEIRVRKETELHQTLLRDMEKIIEEQRIKKEEEIKKRKEAEKQKQEKMAEYIYQFSIGQRCTLPAEMLIPTETQPGKEICPFFSKVAACRFWDTCSRNHVRPALSDTLLFPAFYSHFMMSQFGQVEYDTDLSLEYDDKETYAHFLEFYRDIRYEFESCGRLTRLIVCCNPEAHLRGNVYVSYTSEREAMAAYLKFNARYYAGKQLSCHFVTIPSWKSAICGLYFRKKCPKGNTCNFLHIFKDPGPPFYEPPRNRHSPDTWRWSESPEKDIGQNEVSKRKRQKKESRRSSSHERRYKASDRRRQSHSRQRGRSKSLERRQSEKKNRGSISPERISHSKERKCLSSERRRHRGKRSITPERRSKSIESSSSEGSQSEDRRSRSFERERQSKEKRSRLSSKRSESSERSSLSGRRSRSLERGGPSQGRSGSSERSQNHSRHRRRSRSSERRKDRSNRRSRSSERGRN